MMMRVSKDHFSKSKKVLSTLQSVPEKMDLLVAMAPMKGPFFVGHPVEVFINSNECTSKVFRLKQGCIKPKARSVREINFIKLKALLSIFLFWHVEKMFSRL